MATRNVRDYRSGDGRTAEIILLADPGSGTNVGLTFANLTNIADGIMDEGYRHALLYVRPKLVTLVVKFEFRWKWSADTADIHLTQTSEVNPAGTRTYTDAIETVSTNLTTLKVFPIQVHGNRLTVDAKATGASARYEIAVVFSREALARSVR